MSEYRELVEERIGRPLGYWEHVHHIDGDPTNNDIENLRIVTPGEHARLHAEMRRSGVGVGSGTGLTIGDAAKVLGVSVSTVRNLTVLGKLKADRTPKGHMRFDPADISKFLAASATGGDAS